MGEHVFRAFTSLSEAASASRTMRNGRRVYPGVTIIKAGLGNQRDKNFYPAETLEAAVKNDYFKGLRAYADHPDALSEEMQPERTIRDMVGVYKNPRFMREGTGGRVVADLHLFRSAKWLSDTVDDLIELGQADKIGLSINGRGKTVEKQIQLEESADPLNVNWVEDFITLRSADVVTEAGAGGGFTPHQLLESVRGTAKVKEKAMKRLTEQKKTALKEAADAGDLNAIQSILQECGCQPTSAAKPAKQAVAEADEPEDDDGADALDEAADEIKDDAEGAADADEGEDTGDDDLAEGEDAGDADADDVDADGDDADDAADEDDIEESLKAVSRRGAGVLVKGKRDGKHGGKIKGPKDSMGSALKTGRQNGGQKGRKFGEAQLVRENEKLKDQVARLSTQLRVRTTTDRGRNLLHESAIPAKLRPEILRLLVGKDEQTMRRIIGYHERMIEAVAEEAIGGRVEGAGSRFRESFTDGGSDIGDTLDGLPLKD